MTKPVSPSRLLNAVVAAWAGRADARLRPAGEGPPAGGAPALEYAAPAAEPHVLIAEDNFPNQKVAMLLLKKLGVRIDLA
jgi:hypothetical protein